MEELPVRPHEQRPLLPDTGPRPVKGGKGLRHHEVLIAFSVRAVWQRLRQVDFSLRRFKPAAELQAREILGE